MFKYARKIKNHLLEGLVALSTTTFVLVTIIAALEIDIPLWPLWYFGLAAGAAGFMLALIVCTQFLIAGCSRFINHH